MRKGLLDFHLIMVAVLAASFMFLAAGCLAQPQRQRSSSQEDSLNRFLRDYVGGPSSGDNKATRYFPAFVDLRDDGTQEAIVYLTDVT
jgi:hypothetical protein